MVELITIFITLLTGNMTLHETRVVSPIPSMKMCQQEIIPNILLRHKDEPDRKLLSVACREVIEDKDRT